MFCTQDHVCGKETENRINYTLNYKKAVLTGTAFFVYYSKDTRKNSKFANCKKDRI